MGRPGPDPRPRAALRGRRARATSCRARRASTRPTSPTSRRTSSDTRAADEPRRRSTSSSSTTRAGPARCWPSTTTSASWSRRCARPTSCDNTMIVFLSDNGWLQGEHRITGDKFLPYEESLRIPLIIRGPGRPEGPDDQGPGLQHRLRPDPARRRQREARGGRWTASRCCRPIRKPEQASRTARSRSRRWRRCSRATSRSTPGTARTTACAPTATPTSSGPRPASRSSTTAQTDPYQLQNVADDPAYAAIKAELAAKLVKLDDCAGRSCTDQALRQATGGRSRRPTCWS